MVEGRKGRRGAALKPAVAFDLDNVVVDILESARAAAAAVADIQASAVLDTWLYSSPFTHGDPDVAMRLVTSHDFWQREDILASARPIEGAREALWRLHDAGMLRGYVTRRAERAMGITKAWLEFHGFPGAGLHHVGHHEEMRNYDSCKAETCLRIGATHLVDDSQHEAASALRRAVTPILVDHPLGRAARHAWLLENPGVALARDAVEAVDLLIG